MHQPSIFIKKFVYTLLQASASYRLAIPPILPYLIFCWLLTTGACKTYMSDMNG